MPDGFVSRDTKKIHLNIARLEKGGDRFEIDVDPDLAVAFKKGEDVDIHDVLKAGHIFHDVKKGLVASDLKMEELFSTKDVFEVASIIIKHGLIQVSQEYRNKKLEEKKKRILNVIHRNGIDPKTGLPHPIVRIENAFKEAKISITENQGEEAIIRDIIKKLRPILPIKFEVREIEVSIPSKYASKAYGVVKSFAKVLKESWQGDGSWSGVIEIPAGMQEEFFDKLNSMTHGGVSSRLVKTK